MLNVDVTSQAFCEVHISSLEASEMGVKILGVERSTEPFGRYFDGMLILFRRDFGAAMLSNLRCRGWQANLAPRPGCSCANSTQFPENPRKRLHIFV